MNNDDVLINDLEDEYVPLLGYFHELFVRQINCFSYLEWKTIIQFKIDEDCDIREENNINGNGNCDEIPQRAQAAFQSLLDLAKKFELSDTKNFNTFAALFYKLLQNAYLYQRHSAKSEKLLIIECARDILNDAQYQYIAKIYEIVQLGFCQWLDFRNNYFPTKSHNATFKASDFPLRAEDGDIIYDTIEEDPEPDGKMDCYYNSAVRQEYWKGVNQKAIEAKAIYPKGELANKIMLISEILTMSSITEIWGLSLKKNITDIFDAMAMKYTDIENGYSTKNVEDILDISNCLGRDKSNCDYPYIVIMDHDYEVIDWEKATDQKQEFLDICYNYIMMQPAYLFQDDDDISSQFRKVLAQTIELKNTNKSLEKALEDKKQIIAEFAHTYGNMHTDTLRDIGKALLQVDSSRVKKYARKILLEFEYKQNFKKDIEMLKLQFEDRTSELLIKIRNSISKSEEKKVTDLVSDALQRCFMSILYGGTQGDKSKRELFWGTKDHAEQKVALQDAFDQDVLVDETDMLSWLCKKDLLKLSVDVSEKWQILRFKEGDYAALLITNWLTELLTNALKYADKSMPISLSFKQQNGLLLITIQNQKDATASVLHGTQQGVSSIAANLTKLNMAVGCETKASHINNTDITYQLILTLSEKVLSAD